jgi:hypothetical protein
MPFRRNFRDSSGRRRPDPITTRIAALRMAEWDSEALWDRLDNEPYRGSRNEHEHRAGRNVPSARNGSRWRRRG